MKTQVMLDLETLGNKPGSVIVALGAVKFGDGQILDSFYERVDAESCVAVGLQMNVSAVMWWLKQGDEARKEVTQPGKPLREVLEAFSKWISDADAEVWGNGASFDNVLLADAYDRAGLKCPWKYTNDRCYRTIWNLHLDLPMPPRTGTHHIAIEDAKSQALHLMKLLERVHAT